MKANKVIPSPKQQHAIEIIACDMQPGGKVFLRQGESITQCRYDHETQSHYLGTQRVCGRVARLNFARLSYQYSIVESPEYPIYLWGDGAGSEVLTAGAVPDYEIRRIKKEFPDMSIQELEYNRAELQLTA